MKFNLKSLKPLLILLLLLPVIIHAQIKNKRDVVYLKNGSIIKGTIIEIIPNQNIKIETADGSIFTYTMEEVERTSIEEVGRYKRDADRREKLSEQGVGKIERFWPTGYFIMPRVGPSLTLESFVSGLEISAGLITGIQINEFLSLGVGVELTKLSYSDHSYNNSYQNSNTSTFPFHDEHDSNIPIAPIFFDTRFYVPLRRVHPMFSIQVGYSVVGKRQEDLTYHYYGFIPSDGGSYMTFAAGLRVFITSKISLTADGGPSFQNLKGYTDSYNGTQTGYQSRTVTSLKANVGVIISFGKNQKRE